MHIPHSDNEFAGVFETMLGEVPLGERDLLERLAAARLMKFPL